MNEYYFPLVKGGLGDKFMMLSNILTHRKKYDDDSILYLVNDGPNRSFLNDIKNLNDIVNFFKFKEPKFDIEIKLMTNEKLTLNDFHKLNFKNKNFSNITEKLLKYRSYWPLNFKKDKKNKICWMLYTDNTLKEKIISPTNIKKFNAFVGTFNYENEPLKKFNYSKNIKILSESKILLASEGVWTHVSRAMNVFTIAYSLNEDWIREINDQGHFCSSDFEECLFKLSEKCIEVMK